MGRVLALDSLNFVLVRIFWVLIKTVVRVTAHSNPKHGLLPRIFSVFGWISTRSAGPFSSLCGTPTSFGRSDSCWRHWISIRPRLFDSLAYCLQTISNCTESVKEWTIWQLFKCGVASFLRGKNLAQIQNETFKVFHHVGVLILARIPVNDQVKFGEFAGWSLRFSPRKHIEEKLGLGAHHLKSTLAKTDWVQKFTNSSPWRTIASQTLRRCNQNSFRNCFDESKSRRFRICYTHIGLERVLAGCNRTSSSSFWIFSCTAIMFGYSSHLTHVHLRDVLLWLILRKKQILAVKLHQNRIHFANTFHI